jgi:hypothetical protein
MTALVTAPSTGRRYVQVMAAAEMISAPEEALLTQPADSSAVTDGGASRQAAVSVVTARESNIMEVTQARARDIPPSRPVKLWITPQFLGLWVDFGVGNLR